MDIPNWPETLPRPLAPGYEYEPKPATAGTQMDNGRQRSRLRYRVTPTEVNVRWSFSGEQLTTFEGYFKHILSSGVLPFFAQLSTGRGIVPVRAVFAPGTSYKVVNETFNRWGVTAQLITLEMPVITHDEALIASWRDPDAELASLYELLHVQLPGPLSWQ